MCKNADIKQKTGIVVFNHGAFGGAAKRFTNLFLYLNKKYPGIFFYIINNHLFNQIKGIYSRLPAENIRIVDLKSIKSTLVEKTNGKPYEYKDKIEDSLAVDMKTFLPRKVYWYYKNKFRQKRLFNQIEKLRNQLNIRVFCGIFGGILPLTYYLEQKHRKAAVVFTDMDSWFTDVYADMKRMWYRKYFSFNYALEHSDWVDFLSPYVLDGVKKLGVKLKEESVSVSPCSFADYSKCFAGEKSNFEIAFASRLEPDKNPMLYLEAAREITVKYPNVKFHLLGEGSMVSEIYDFIKKNSLENKINFTFHNNPPEVFSRTSVFVTLQSNTNYPSQSVLEAMACGNAIIASKRGDTGLFINNDNGLLTELSKGELVNALEFLINQKETTLKMGQNARSFVLQNHTIEKFSEYYLGIINKAAEEIKF
jgi:glycosyltransferase involved in cell wall biosynthesis